MPDECLSCSFYGKTVLYGPTDRGSHAVYGCSRSICKFDDEEYDKEGEEE